MDGFRDCFTGEVVAFGFGLLKKSLKRSICDSVVALGRDLNYCE